MKPTLTPQDWAQLSEYLDGQLGAEAARKLEARLSLSAELRQGLEDLKHTRAMLRALRPHPVPHNFTLTRAMAAEARRVSRWFPVLSFSSVIATLSAVVLMGLRLLPLSAPNLMAAPAAAPAPMMMESMDAASAPAEAGAEMAAEPTPMIITWGFQGVPGFGMGGGGGDTMGRGGGTEMEDAMPVPAPAELAAPAAPEGEMTAADAVPTELPAEPEGATAAAEPAPTEVPAEPPSAKEAPTVPMEAPTEVPLQSGDLILGLPAPEEQGQMLVPQSSAAAEAYAAPSENRESQESAYPTAQPWVLPLSLLTLGVGLGLAAWQVRRR
ncbi:anti-sigma factor family protein [Levilinea saccharolytica]|uniref:Zinc-finger domain-containing protein n=1 Tax=Levilinea saccharolytica TaxID=229921 RepID=A0A0P6YCZ7_9CHLR|nr:hypothetical protein [Levilinea saccharolytica]KPL79825.1 hypothetical protein ADN01_12795 [Levilinea saccharolytica]KPL79893.1 hypothetical protein ADN01_13280 [Levilinea saccharolytica]GAP16910.1 hypothetical protein LSAC_00767 [Levilinea saccharolytica]